MLQLGALVPELVIFPENQQKFFLVSEIREGGGEFYVLFVFFRGEVPEEQCVVQIFCSLQGNSPIAPLFFILLSVFQSLCNVTTNYGDNGWSFRNI